MLPEQGETAMPLRFCTSPDRESKATEMGVMPVQSVSVAVIAIMASASMISSSTDKGAITVLLRLPDFYFGAVCAADGGREMASDHEHRDFAGCHAAAALRQSSVTSGTDGC